MPIKKIGLLTSGGDAPGMNAAIRAIVRTAIDERIDVIGFLQGYNGLIHDRQIALSRYSVSNIIQHGGTILGTARSTEFETSRGMAQAAQTIEHNKINALIVIGGEGTMTGAYRFSMKHRIKAVGLPGTIDNDIFGSDYTIGFDTAVNNALRAVDQIRDTASSLERLFFIEVMGRDAGHIGLAVGLSGGAEDVLIPETPTSIRKLAAALQKNIKKGKKSNIVIVSEGDEAGNALQMAEKIKKILKEEYRVAVLGYIQRGGSPTAYDRILASRLGYHAVIGLIKGRSGCMVGEINKKIVYTPFKLTYTRKKKIDIRDYGLIRVLAQ